jgi:glycosyltransferase involved in cell wall biosynthesis
MFSKENLRIAYVMQNVGIDLREDVGPASLVKQTVRGLRNAGHTISIISLKNRSVVQIDNFKTFHENRYLSLGYTGSRAFKFTESCIRRFQRVFKIPYFALFDSFRFFDALNQNVSNYNICHEYGGLFNLGASLACSLKRIPYVVTIEADAFLEKSIKGNPLKGFHADFALWQAQKTFNLAQKIITVSTSAKSHLVNRYRLDPQRIVVIPNGVDVELFHPDFDSQAIRKTLRLEDGPVIGFVGGFQAWHGIDLLVDCFTQVLNEFPQAQLLLVGDGQIRSQIERRVNNLGIRSKVLFTGLLPQKEIPALLSAIDVGIVPYPKISQEIWFSPLKLYEYMAAGKAIVASKSGQIAEVIRHGINGLLTNPGDKDDLTRAINILLEDPEKRKQLGTNARSQAVAEHSWDHYTRRLENVYLEVIRDYRI